ncbi:TPA: hypothetical protein ACGW5N_003078 [Bacillus mobilis]
MGEFTKEPGGHRVADPGGGWKCNEEPGTGWKSIFGPGTGI